MDREGASGLTGRVVEEVARWVTAPIVAVDIASGLSSDTGEIPGPALRADVTVTFAAPKHGHVLPPSCDRTGELIVADIGIAVDPTSLGLIQPADAARAYPPRRPDAHKGDFGHVLAVAGSPGKSGAAALCGTAALRVGAGLVTVATSQSLQPIVAAARAELITEALVADPLARCLELALRLNAMADGPALGCEAAVLSRVIAAGATVPLVIDSKCLNSLAPEAAHVCPRSRLDRAHIPIRVRSGAC